MSKLELVSKKLVENCKCKKVNVSDIKDFESETVPEMEKIMGRNLGLAAPQVGIFRNMFIMKYGNEIISCYNPLWSFILKKKTYAEEGCLSYGRRNTVKMARYKIINVEFQNSEGNFVKLKLRGTDARVFQHEADHLIGKTIFNQ